MRDFYTADFVMGGVTLAAAIFGLFGGFSGALGFFAGVLAAGAALKFSQPYVARFFSYDWSVALAMLALALLAFGLARMLVKRIVKGLLAQPADAIFGALVAASTGAAVSFAGVFAAKNLLEAPVESGVYALVMGLLGT